MAAPKNKKPNLWQRLDSVLARRAWAPSPEGILWFVLSLLIMVQGWLRGFNLVTFIATFLLAMWFVNALTTRFMGRRLKGLLFQRRLQGLVHAGTPTMMSLEVINPGPTGVAGVRVLDEGPAHRLDWGIQELPAEERVSVQQALTPWQRGVYQWKPLHVSSGYPFGLFRRSLSQPIQQTSSIVLPMLGRLDQIQFRRWLRSSQRLANTLTRERPARCIAPADFYGIREYRSGDSPRWIHWRTTARIGEPMVREFEEPPQHHLTLVLEAWLPQGEEELMAAWRKTHRENLKTIRTLYRMLGAPTPEQKTAKEAQLAKKEEPYRAPLDHIEAAVSLAATLCWTWTRRLGSNITIAFADETNNAQVVYDSGPTLRTAMPLLERLAVVKAGVKPKTDGLTKALSDRRIPKGPIVVISPHASTLHLHLSKTLGRPVHLLDVSLPTVKRFFATQAKAVLESS
jgi:hypothetical protein